ncbi:hypothetical protein [Endothiovibrio diazotrophicus]
MIPLALLIALAQLGWLLSDRGGAVWIGFPIDDAWIHLDYVRGLLRDGLPTYNPGVPEAGFSSPLWLFAVMPFHLAGEALGLPPAVGVKFASWLFGLLTALSLGTLAGRLSGSKWAARLTAALPLLHPDFTFSMLSGMEVTLAAWLVMLTLSASQDERVGRCGFYAALAMLARPEAAMVPLLLAPFILIAAPRGEGGKRLVALFAPSLLLGLGWIGYTLWATGYPLPSTFLIKSSPWISLGERAGDLLLYWRVLLPRDGLDVLISSTLLFAVGMTALWRRVGWQTTGAMLIVLLGSVVATGLTRSLSLGYYVERYFHPFIPLALLFVGIGGWAAARAVASRIDNRPLRHTVAVLVALIALAPRLPDWWLTARLYQDYCLHTHWLHALLAQRLAERAPADAVIAVEGAGAMRYFADRPIIDLVGLNDHRLVRATRSPAGLTGLSDLPATHAPEHAMKVLCAMRERGASLAAVPDEWGPTLLRGFKMQRMDIAHVDHWAIAGYSGPRTVSVFTLAARPELAAACAHSAAAEASEKRIDAKSD